MLFVKIFRVRQRQSVSIRLTNVAIMRDPRLSELRLDEVMQHCLPYSMKTLISQVKRRIPGNEAVYCDIINTVPAHIFCIEHKYILLNANIFS